MSGQEQKRRQRPGGHHDESSDEEASDLLDRGTIDVNEKMNEMARKIREASAIELGFSDVCCDMCGCPCHPGGGCTLTPICSRGTHPCPC